MTFPRILLALLLAAPAAVPDAATLGDAFVTHEWGTLTSVAGADGDPVAWSALLGSSDLPCFVDRLGQVNPKFPPAYVRMETPVLYFYSPRPLTISVGVKFPEGWITEWYPRASAVHPKAPGFPSPATALGNAPWKLYAGGEIRWDGVEALPGPDLAYPRGKGDSPYYAARQTHSTPLRLGRQQEKLIFYRGIGNFEVPLRPMFVSDGVVEIRNAGSEEIPLVVLFENRDGRMGYRRASGIVGRVQIPMPDLTGDVASLRDELVRDLVRFGLFQDEAEAMLETWSESWFEEGARVMYILPRSTVDAFLPLDIQPTPTSVARVFVGRVELLSPWIRHKIQAAAAGRDGAELEKLGRFLTAFAAQVRGLQADAYRQVQEASGRLLRRQFDGPSCVQ